MSWVLDSLVLFGEDANAENYCIQEEVCQDVCCLLLTRETEVDPILHYQETLLTPVAKESFSHSVVDLAQSPASLFVCTAFAVNENAAKFCTH